MDMTVGQSTPPLLEDAPPTTRDPATETDTPTIIDIQPTSVSQSAHAITNTAQQLPTEQSLSAADSQQEHLNLKRQIEEAECELNQINRLINETEMCRNVTVYCGVHVKNRTKALWDIGLGTACLAVWGSNYFLQNTINR